MAGRKYQCKKRCQKKSKTILEEAKERTNKACNSKDLGSVCDLDVNLLFARG